VEKFETAHRPGEKGSGGRAQPRRSPSDGSRNAHASKTTKRGAAGFVVVFAAGNLGQL
jgi:hypothetical protein